MLVDQGKSISVWFQTLLAQQPKRNSSNVLSLLQELADEASKYKRLARLHQTHGIPIYQYQELDSDLDPVSHFAQIIKIPSFDGYAIRAVPLPAHIGDLQIHRAQGLSTSECQQFILNLHSSHKLYRVLVNSYFFPHFSGTIIVQKRGLLLELAQGPHFDLNQQNCDSGNIFAAYLRLPNHSMCYNTTDTAIRSIMWQAVLFLKTGGKLINPLTFVDDLIQGYFEFVYHRQYGYKFIDYRNSSFWSSLPFE